MLPLKIPKFIRKYALMVMVKNLKNFLQSDLDTPTEDDLPIPRFWL